LIDEAPTLKKKRRVELKTMHTRRYAEKNLKVPIVDDYGLERIDSMTADIRAEYATQIGDDDGADESE
jgi:hypothetical protein